MINDHFESIDMKREKSIEQLNKDQKFETRAMPNKMKKFIDNLRIEAGKIGMKSHVNELEHRLHAWPSAQKQNTSIQIEISKNLTFLYVESFNRSLNIYMLDFIDILCHDYGYAFTASGAHSGANEYGIQLGSIWAILKKE